VARCVRGVPLYWKLSQWPRSGYILWVLRELHISNLAVIEDASIEFGEGLNCFTGQTGAGKSLVIGALEILLGLRGGGGGMLRAGASEARVAGLFEVRDEALAKEIARVVDQAVACGDQLLIRRKLFESGRSSFTLNGQPVTVAMARAIGALLVDVHGRHDHQYLLQPSHQLQVLDAFGGLTELAQQYRKIHAKLNRLEQQRDQLEASRTLRRRQLELYEFQADEIDTANLVAGEYAQLQARHRVLINLQKIKRDTGTAYGALYEDEGAIIERLEAVARILEDLASVDEALSGVADQIRTAALSLQDGAVGLNRYTDRLEVDPGELVEAEERLNTLNRLIAKYANQPGVNQGDDPVAELLAYREELDRQIAQLRGQDEDLDQMDAQITSLKGDLDRMGAGLGRSRRAAAGGLKPLIERELRELGMADARFDVVFEPGGAQGGNRGAGLETAEMFVGTNPGQPAHPLRKIASSGEMSRIMLAIKSILAHNDRVSVLVFDEIDANIGGRMGTVIGTKLRKLTQGEPGGGHRGHQVLCITHLPQIAAFGDRHLHITKTVSGKGKSRQTRTTVSLLDGDKRVDELAEMLVGKHISDTSRRQAREMLEAAGAETAVDACTSPG